MLLTTDLVEQLKTAGITATTSIDPGGREIVQHGDMRVWIYGPSSDGSDFIYNFKDLAKPHHHGYHYGLPRKFVSDLIAVLRGENVCPACAT